MGVLGSSDQKGAVILHSDCSQLAAWMEGDSEDSEKERIAGRIWVPSCLNQGMWQRQCVTSQSEAMEVLHALTAAALYHYLKWYTLSESRCHCSGFIRFLFHCLSWLHTFKSSTHKISLPVYMDVDLCPCRCYKFLKACRGWQKCVPPILLVMIDVTASPPTN